MPIYEYQCTACGHHLEVIQKMSDQPLTDCPECHQATLSKLVSAAGFQLKGTGWYVTDYSAKGKSKAKAESESGGNAQSTGTTDSKTPDTKSSESTTKASSDTGKSSTDSGAKS